jgi:hypothetical protein
VHSNRENFKTSIKTKMCSDFIDALKVSPQNLKGGCDPPLFEKSNAKSTPPPLKPPYAISLIMSFNAKSPSTGAFVFFDARLVAGFGSAGDACLALLAFLLLAVLTLGSLDAGNSFGINTQKRAGM